MFRLYGSLPCEVWNGRPDHDHDPRPSGTFPLVEDIVTIETHEMDPVYREYGDVRNHT